MHVDINAALTSGLYRKRGFIYKAKRLNVVGRSSGTRGRFCIGFYLISWVVEKYERFWAWSAGAYRLWIVGSGVANIKLRWIWVLLGLDRQNAGWTKEHIWACWRKARWQCSWGDMLDQVVYVMLITDWVQADCTYTLPLYMCSKGLTAHEWSRFCRRMVF